MRVLDALRAYFTHDATTIAVLRAENERLRSELRCARAEMHNMQERLDERVIAAIWEARALKDARRVGRFYVLDGERVA